MSPSPFANSIVSNLDEIATPGTKTETGPLNFGPIVNHLTSTPLYKYSGSLTTPPCSEGVTWLVASKTLPLDVNSYNKLKSVVRFNARYTQNAPGQTNLLALACAA